MRFVPFAEHGDGVRTGRLDPPDDRLAGGIDLQLDAADRTLEHDDAKRDVVRSQGWDRALGARVAQELQQLALQRAQNEQVDGAIDELGRR
jgi:hypothetical protein